MEICGFKIQRTSERLIPLLKKARSFIFVSLNNHKILVLCILQVQTITQLKIIFKDSKIIHIND